MVAFIAGLGSACVTQWALRRTPVHATGSGWTITRLQAHAEAQAHAWRLVSMAFTIAMVMYVVYMGYCVLKDLPWVPTPSTADSTPALVKLSVVVIFAALLILISRILWNYANVWLGRAGTLEDLCLALTFLSIDPTAPRALSASETQQLVMIAETFERLRRSFEGDLLKGPAFELPKIGK
jgi:hypothetical protein